MDQELDPFAADGIAHSAPRRKAASTESGGSAPTADPIEAAPDDASVGLAAPAPEDFVSDTPILRAGALAIIIFQMGYTLLDRVVNPLKFPRTAPMHILCIVVGLLAFAATLTSFARPYWRGLTLATCAAILTCMTCIAVIVGHFDVLVASNLLFFLAAGTMIPWSPRWQAALEGWGVLGLLGYTMFRAEPDPRIAVASTMVLGAALFAQLASIHASRFRRKLAEQLAALAANERLLRHEIALRSEIAAARELDLARLQSSETMLRKLFDASPDNIAINSLSDGRFIAVNDCYQVAGYTRHDVLNSDVLTLGMWPDLDELERFVKLIHQTGHVKNMEITQRRRDGTIETNLISASIVELNGEPCVMSMTRDITEIKRVETSLRASHVAMRKIFDATLDAIIVTRLADGSHIDFNQQLEQFGYMRKYLDEATAGRRQLWVNEAQHQEFRARVLADGVVRNMEADLLLPDGSLIPALIAAVRVDLEGQDCVVTMIRDMTGAHEASRKLEESVKALSASEDTFRRLFDANLDSMTLTGIEGIYLDVNQEFCRATGYTREEAIGHHFAELNMWIYPDEMLAFANQFTSDGEVRNLETTFRRKDGTEAPQLLSAVRLELQGKLCCLTIAREITDVKMTQRELVAAREAAVAASRAKSEFLSIMSHEIRTPMNAIIGMTDMLMETSLDSEQKRYLNTVVSNGYALLELINSILDLARVESGRLSLEAVEFDPRDVTEKALETLAIRAHEKGLELMVRFAPAVPEVALGDPLRLGQVLINLVGNAIKFTSRGQVLVSVEPHSSSAASIGLEFCVTDTGIGISPDKLHLLFQPFTQADSSTSRKFGGSGLGLAIVSRLVALMNGKVEVASEPGNGSRFSFTAQFGTSASRPALAGPRNPDFSDLRILLIDDNRDNRSIVSELLTAQGAQVTPALSRTEVLTELGRDVSSDSRAPILLLDATMPGYGGFEIIKQLEYGSLGRPRIVMMLRTTDLTNDIARLRAIGVDNYIVKPVRRAELFAAIARARNGINVKPQAGKPAPPAAAQPASISTPILDRPLEILIADDSPDNRALIRAYLKKTPYSLEEAADGQQAIDKFVNGKFDLVLMDIQMPILDGYEATGRIRRWECANNRRPTPIIALTASALEEAAHRTKAAGCDAHVTKPVKKSTLFTAICDVIEAQRSKETTKRSEVTDPKEDICRTQ